jgi:hypothetical protein
MCGPFLKQDWHFFEQLFPHAILLPDGRVFVAANNKAMIYDVGAFLLWMCCLNARRSGRTTKSSVCLTFQTMRVYHAAHSKAHLIAGPRLLPIRRWLGFVASQVVQRLATRSRLLRWHQSRQRPIRQQEHQSHCQMLSHGPHQQRDQPGLFVWNDFGKRWLTSFTGQSEEAPDGRIMGNMVLTPGKSFLQLIRKPTFCRKDGKIVYINGAASGTAGLCALFLGLKSKLKPLHSYNDRQSDGSFSSAAGPRRTPYLYDPDQSAGKRWSSLGTSGKVNRMYHSVASLYVSSACLSTA